MLAIPQASGRAVAPAPAAWSAAAPPLPPRSLQYTSAILSKGRKLASSQKLY
jgi:hypothetical protein